MNAKQTPKLAAAITEHQEAFENLLTTEEAQAAIRDPRGFIAAACEAWKVRLNKTLVFNEQLTDWRHFYREVFSFTDTESINPTLPLETTGFNWLVVVRKGLTLNKVLEVMCTKFNVYSYIGDDLDKGVPTNDRTADNDYTISVRDCVEADEENKKLSANQIKEKRTISMTLLERLLLELFYFWETGGQHLDIRNVTLCSGSRYSGGGVPSVCWDSDSSKVSIGWYHTGYSDGDLRAREAVVG